MFFVLELKHEIILHPQFFGPGLKDTIHRKLYSEVESTCNGQHGFIIAVIQVLDIGQGRVIPGRGHSLFPVSYKALVFRPFVGEVLDAVVKIVNRHGLFCDVGPLTSVFVSAHWMPTMEFDDNAQPARYRTADESESISPDDGIRIRIIGTRVDAIKIAVTAEYLDIID